MATKRAKPAPAEPAAKAEPVVIKKYANRRLYDTKASAYVTLNDLAKMARDGVEFVVQDARTGEDLTRSVLVQIILESEASGDNLLPLNFLRHLVGLYGDTLQWAVPGYLDSAMDVFLHNQNALRDQVSTAITDNPAMAGLEQMARMNHEIFSRTMRMFVSMNGSGAGDDESGEDAAAAAQSELEAMRKQMATMQRQLDRLTSKG